MKILNENFRDIDRKWIAVERWKDLNRISKAIKEELDDAVILAYIFIDHEKGICAKVIGNVEFENKELTVDSKFIDKDYIIYSDTLKKIKFEIVDDKTIKAIKGLNLIKEGIYDTYYNKPSIIKARKLEDLDQFRDEFSPDDLELYFEKGKESELIWGRVEVYSKEKNILACSLLNDSKIDKDYKKNSYVFVKIIKDKKDTDIVIDALANIKK